VASSVSGSEKDTKKPSHSAKHGNLRKILRRTYLLESEWPTIVKKARHHMTSPLNAPVEARTHKEENQEPTSITPHLPHTGVLTVSGIIPDLPLIGLVQEDSTR
jgi:hypothetical protein